jgi:tripeptide aminopeptidase
MINSNRIFTQFQELTRISSPSKKERKIADYLKAKLQSLGLTVREDSAGQAIGGEAGNIVAVLEATGQGPKMLFAVHMDTVMPGEGVIPVFKDGYFRSAGQTVLGADDKAGIAAILEALQVIKEKGLPHPRLTVVCSVAEEMGLLGALNLDIAQIDADYGFVLDSSGPIGNVIVRGPTQSIIKAVIRGRAAHAGIAPEEGISAIQIAAEAIRRMKLGRIDHETTANIGVINGGVATNIVPEEVTVEGEARSLEPAKLAQLNEQIKKAFETAAEDFAGSCQVEINQAYPAIQSLEGHRIIGLILKAGNKLGIPIRLVATGGGSDANIFNGRGLPTVNLATGMEKVHTKKEELKAGDLVKLAEFVLALMTS